MKHLNMMIHLKRYSYNIVIFVLHFIVEIYETEQNTVVGNVRVDLVYIITGSLKYYSRYLGVLCFANSGSIYRMAIP